MASGSPAGLPACLASMLAELERKVGFAEGVVMSFDPDVLLPTAFAATAERSLDEALAACRNEQLDHDFLKFRDLAVSTRRRGGGRSPTGRSHGKCRCGSGLGGLLSLRDRPRLAGPGGHRP